MTESLIALFERDLNRLKTEIELVEERHLWKTIPGVTNSIGNLTLHLCGNLQHFIGALLGQTGYIRERDKEFSDKGLSKEELYKSIKSTYLVIKESLEKLNTTEVKNTYPIKMWGKEISTEFFLIHLESHLNYHLGQINYLRRIFSSTD